VFGVVVVTFGALAPTSSGDGGARGIFPSGTTLIVEPGAAAVTTISGLEARGCTGEVEVMMGGIGMSSLARRLSEPGSTV